MTEVKTHSEHIELVKKQAKEYHFRKHVATHKVIANSGGVRVEHLLWKIPGGSNCYMTGQENLADSPWGRKGGLAPWSVTPARYILHLEGIKMAWDQLEAVDA